jgi:hypothetical protein
MGISLINMSYINMFSTRLLLIEAKTWGEGDRGEKGWRGIICCTVQAM